MAQAMYTWKCQQNGTGWAGTESTRISRIKEECVLLRLGSLPGSWELGSMLSMESLALLYRIQQATYQKGSTLILQKSGGIVTGGKRGRVR